MSNGHHKLITEGIVSSILSLYAENGSKFHLQFEDRSFTMRQFLERVLPSLADIEWPVDKEEVRRVWHSLYIIEDKSINPALTARMPPPSASSTTEEVILLPEYVRRIICKHPNKTQPNRLTLHVDPLTGYQKAPTVEVRLSSFASCWYMSTDPFIKRFTIIKDATIITLLVGKKKSWNGSTRFTLTWLPHVHLNPVKVIRRKGDNLAFDPYPVDGILTSTSKLLRNHRDVTALVWNVRQDINIRFGSQFSELVATERPQLVILTGTGNFNTASEVVTKALGYDKVFCEGNDEGVRNGFCILSNQKDLTVEEHACYPNSKHIRIIGSQARGKWGNKQLWHLLKTEGGTIHSALRKFAFTTNHKKELFSLRE